MKVGSTKGSLPPGFSIEPNLLLYEVAKREERADAEQYYQAAQLMSDGCLCSSQTVCPVLLNLSDAAPCFCFVRIQNAGEPD